MRKQLLLLKTLLVAVLLGVGVNDAWGDETLIDNVDFETEATILNGWTFPNGNITSYQNLYDTEDANSGHYIELINNRNGANRSGYFTFSNSTLTSAAKWRLEFDFGLASQNSSSGTSQTMRVTCASGDVLTITNENSSTSASVTSTLSPSSALCTLTVPIVSSNAIVRYSAVPAFHITIECKSDGVYATITSLDKKTSHLAETKIANVTTLSKINFGTGKYYSNQSYDNIKTWVIVDEDVVSDPAVAITGVSGTQRTVTITPGSSLLKKSVTTYYTTNGDAPTTSSSVYSTPLTISSSCTVKAVTISAESVSSNVVSLAVSAGTEVQLAAPKVAVTSMEANGSYYTPRYTISYDNSEVLLTPTSTLAATFNGSPVDISGGTFDPSAQGTLVVTATCDGYKSNTTEVTMKPLYELKHESPNFNEIALANIETTLGAGTWDASAGSGRWANWSKTGGVNANLTANNSDAYYYATVNDDFTYDSWLTVDIGSAFQYLAGFGFGSNDKNNTASCSIVGAVANSIAAYTYCRNASATVDYKDGTSSYTIPTSMALKKVVYYAPLPATVPATITDAGYATFSSTYAIDCEHLPTGVEAYIVTGDNGNSITTQKVETAVAAGTGLILKGDADTYNIPVAVTGTDYSSTNKLWAITSDGTVNPATDANYTNYVLAKQNGKVVFAPITGSNSAPVKEGQAALSLYTGSTNNARALRVTFGSDVTGISDATRLKEKGQMTNGVFNLNGQRMKKAAKGLYIVNGKKYIK